MIDAQSTMTYWTPPPQSIFRTKPSVNEYTNKQPTKPTTLAYLPQCADEAWQPPMCKHFPKRDSWEEPPSAKHAQ